MSSVTSRIKEIKQPRGGYIKPSQFQEIAFDDGETLSEQENIHASIVGMVVDYLTRYIMGTNIKEAFKISIQGYIIRTKIVNEAVINEDRKKQIDIISLLKQVKGLDDNSIIAACKIVTYDVWYRNTLSAMLSKSAEEINPDRNTIGNIRIMVNRSVKFWDIYGEINSDGFTFIEKDDKGNIIHNGYTLTVNTGDGDYLTEDTIWDFKVTKSKPTNKHTLQLLMYWIMGKHSGMDKFKNINKLGIFNPRLNKVYILEVTKISNEIIKQVEDEVICY